MRNFLAVLVVVQFAFVVAFAQITFTREWVTGKRSNGPSRLIIKDSRGQRLLPALDYLIKNEDLKKLGFGTPEKRLALPWRVSDGVPKSLSGDPMKEDQNAQYDIEIPNQKYKPGIN